MDLIWFYCGSKDRSNKRILPNINFAFLMPQPYLIVSNRPQPSRKGSVFFDK